MSQFLERDDDDWEGGLDELDIGYNDKTAERKAKASVRVPQMYDLRGILMHKGSSAYHGHYESQVYDVM